MANVIGPSRSRLSVARRFKAVFPLLVVLTITIGFNLYVAHGHAIAIKELPKDRLMVVENEPGILTALIGTGLDRIRAAGFHLSWDQRPVEQAPPPPPRLSPEAEAQRIRDEKNREYERSYDEYIRKIMSAHPNNHDLDRFHD